MLLIANGISGVGIKESIKKYINEASHHFISSNGEECPLHFFKLEEEIQKIYFEENEIEKSHQNTEIWIKEILCLPNPKFKNLWNSALNNIAVKVEEIKNKKSNDIIILNMHACYYHRKTEEYFSSLDFDKLSKLQPDIIINLIDDIYDVYHRLSQPGTIYHNVSIISKSQSIFRLIKLLDWRAKEILNSRLLGNNLKKDSVSIPHYLLAVKHGYYTLSNIIKDKSTIYLSHPISEVRRLEKSNITNNHAIAKRIKEEVNYLSDFLSKRFVTFLPTTIDEYRISFDKVENKRFFHTCLTQRWDEDKYIVPAEVLYDSSGFEGINEELWLDVCDHIEDKELNELLNILSDLISHQVTTRDHILVEQSQYIVIFRPLFNGNASRGVYREFEYFHELYMPSDSKDKCIVFSPMSDFKKLLVRAFNKIIESELKNGNLIEEKEFKGLNEEDEAKLQDINGDKNSFNLFLVHFLNNYSIRTSIVNVEAPLAPDNVNLYQDKLFIMFLEETYEKLEIFRKNSILIEKELEIGDVSREIASIISSN